MVVSVADFLDNAGDDDLEMDENGGLTSKHMKSLENLYGKFEGYCKELVVFGFNSAGYDIKLIKKYLFKELCEHGKDDTIETLFPDPHYSAETHMPLSETPRLDLYFTHSELTTLSLLLMGCVEHTCRGHSEYCLLSFKRRFLQSPPCSKDAS